MTELVKKAIESCTTATQVRQILRANGIKIARDETKDSGYFNVWVDDVTRIYKPYHRKTMTVQVFQKFRAEYSGIPVFFG